MTDYISREAAMEIVKRTSGDYAAAFSEIRKLPAADVEPVRHKENRHFCPDCIYHEHIFEGAVFRGTKCRSEDKND